MADPAHHAELGCSFACLSQLIFHLHSGLGGASPDDALQELLTALQGSFPSLGREQGVIKSRFSEYLGNNDTPYHPGLLPLWPVDSYRLNVTPKLELTQYLSPFLLHDTIIVEISSETHDLLLSDADQISRLRQAAVEFVHSGFQPSLGQCFILYLQAEDQSLAFAEAWARAIGPQDLRPSAEASLLGRPIFEFSNESSTWHIWFDDPGHPIHQETLGNCQQHLFNLLCCRAKLEYAARAARQSFVDGMEVYQRIEQRGAELAQLDAPQPLPPSSGSSTGLIHQPGGAEFAPFDSSRIARLEDHLRLLPQYGLRLARCERDLLAYRHTSSTNAFNAAQASQALLQPEDTFLKSVLEQEVPTRLRQMDHDAQVLHSGQRHAEQLISSLRAIVDLDGQKLQLQLEQEEKARDRNLQTTIFFVSAALSISALAASTRQRPGTKLLTEYAPQVRTTPPLLWLADISIHFLLGITASLCVLLPWMAWRAARSRLRGRASRTD